MQRETGWETVRDDEAVSGTARDLESERPEGGDSEPQWTYRCQRLNRRVQARYRQFPVNPPGSEAEPLGEQAMHGGDMAEGELLSRERQFDIEPATEVDVEAAPIMGFDEMGAIGTSDLIEPRQAGAAESAGSQYPERQGLRAIFAVESDRLDDTAGELAAEANWQQELTAEARQPDELTAQTERPEGLIAGAEWLGEPTEIPQAEPQDADSRQVPYDRPQGQIIWKSFPKPLREKNK
jgi:hypothetical protein